MKSQGGAIEARRSGGKGNTGDATKICPIPWDQSCGAAKIVPTATAVVDAQTHKKLRCWLGTRTIASGLGDLMTIMSRFALSDIYLR